MKQSRLFIIALSCTLACSLFALSACGGGSAGTSESSSSESSSSVSQESVSSASTDESEYSSSSTANMSESDVRAAFQQMTMGMVDFYSGSSEAGEQVYYAGGSSGSNAIIAFIEPSSSQIASFIGPVSVSDDGRLTITDSTSGNSITFAVIGNSDSTVTFDMGSAYGTATVAPCASDEIVDALTQVSMIAIQSENDAAQASEATSESTTE